MKTVHQFQMKGVCPVNQDVDHYQVEMTIFSCAYGTQEVTTIESILDWCARFHQEPRFQEDFTRALSAEFLARVKTTCLHRGVHTVCEVEGDTSEP